MAKLPCPPELWSDFSTLLDEALELPPPERLAWVETLGDRHAEIKPWLRLVLKSGDGSVTTTDFLNAPVVDRPLQSEFASGQCLGHFTLLEPIGRGGMGEVWKAIRDDMPGRAIALKLPYPHLLAEVLLRRFERERDILAKLNHPHIARLYSAGLVNDRPYLEMELVEGIPISRYCREHGLSLHQRLALFQQVLAAVGAAHGQLISHRDLKPSNILVSASGAVKLLDFGIAGMLGGQTGSELTQGASPLTPEYAAPEQRNTRNATVAIDIYALGVVLYELLTGQRPFNRHQHSADNAPPLASGNLDPTFASTTGLSARQLHKTLQGDLDAILAKALDTDPSARYRTTEAFAEDIHAYLNLRPISARHIGNVSRSLKFIRRHAVAAAMTVLLLLTILGGSAGVAWQAILAQHEAHRANVTKDFLSDILSDADPVLAQDKSRGVDSANLRLELSVRRIEKEFASEPEVQIDLLNSIIHIFDNLDDMERAFIIAQKACTIANQRFSPYNALSIDECLNEATYARRMGNFEISDRLLSDLDQRINQGDLNNSATRAHWIIKQHDRFQSRAAPSPELEQLRDHAIELMRRHEPNSPVLAFALRNRGRDALCIQLCLVPENFDNAERDLKEALEVASRAGALTDIAQFNIDEMLARLYSIDNRFEQAKLYFEKAEDVVSASFGPGSPQDIEVTYYWARALYETGHRAEAFALLESKLPLVPSIRSIPQDNPNRAAIYLSFWLTRARAIAGAGNPLIALPAFNDMEAALRDPGPTIDPMLLQRTLLAFGDAEDRLGHAADAERHLHEAYWMVKAPGPTQRPLGHLDRAVPQERWAKFLNDHQRTDEAIPLLKEVIDTTPPQIAFPQALARSELAKISLRGGRVEEALALARQADAEMNRAPKLYDIRLKVRVEVILADALKASGDEVAAQRLNQQILEELEQYNAPESPELQAARARVS